VIVIVHYMYLRAATEVRVYVCALELEVLYLHFNLRYLYLRYKFNIWYLLLDYLIQVCISYSAYHRLLVSTAYTRI